MKIVGIICEYNPFHLGHQKQFRLVREHYGPDTGIVCLMSGNFVQRGAPAIFDKSIRARAAIISDSVLIDIEWIGYSLTSIISPFLPGSKVRVIVFSV